MQEMFVITSDIAVLFKRWLIATGQGQVVKSFEGLPPTRNEITVQRVMDLVAYRYLRGSVEDLCSKSHMWHISGARQIACYLARKHTSASLPALGRMMGGLHHSTVRHGIERVKFKMEADKFFSKEIAELEENLKPALEKIAEL